MVPTLPSNHPLKRAMLHLPPPPPPLKGAAPILGGPRGGGGSSGDPSPSPWQVKIQGQNKEMLAAACQMFLGKSESEIGQIALETLEGHQRAIMAHMTVEVGLGGATPTLGKPRPSQNSHTHLGSSQTPPFGMRHGPFKKSQIYLEGQLAQKPHPPG